jgi:hypothetical protein
VAAFICGSVARVLADEFSDIELCFIWREEPPDKNRRDVIQAFGGELFSDWLPWKSDLLGLEDDIYVNGFQIDI